MGAKLSYPSVDLAGKVCIVTGASSGIGRETAKVLYSMGAHVVMACRSEEKTKMVMREVTAEVSEKQTKFIPGSLEFMKLDLASLQSTKDFTDMFKSRHKQLHILINNAGIALAPKGYTGDGYERHFQINHLGHFLLTMELLPVLQSSTPDARVVFVASVGHKSGVFEMANMQAEHSYSRMKFYGSSKLFNIMTSIALQRRLKGSSVTVSSLHPGVVSTDITRNADDLVVMRVLQKVDHKVGLGRTPKDGAMTTLNAAVNPDLNQEDAAYYVDCKQSTPSILARDEAKQEMLWEISCKMVRNYLSPDINLEYGLGKVSHPQQRCMIKSLSRSQPNLSSNGDRCDVNFMQM